MFKHSYPRKENININGVEINLDEGFTRVTMSAFMKISDLIRYGKIPGKIMVVSER